MRNQSELEVQHANYQKRQRRDFVLIKEFLHAQRAYIELWMHAGSLEGKKNA